jgi:hypothetical protein
MATHLLIYLEIYFCQHKLLKLDTYRWIALISGIYLISVWHITNRDLQLRYKIIASKDIPNSV